MGKAAYIGIQIFWSFVVATAIWYLSTNIIFMFEVSEENVLIPFIIMGIGFLIYTVLTVGYILFGYKKVDDWRPWLVGVSIGINIVVSGMALCVAAVMAVFI